MNMLEVIVKGAEEAARRDDPPAAPPTDPPGRSLKLAALVARNGPQDHFVGLRPTAPLLLTCPFYDTDPPLAAQITDRFIVNYNNNNCHANPQVSGQSVAEAWAKWNSRA